MIMVTPINIVYINWFYKHKIVKLINGIPIFNPIIADILGYIKYTGFNEM